jgi:predicted dinucleotide-binding enzyme
MKIAVLGTGMVGRALAARLVACNHDVVIGTRDVEQTLARTEPGAMGHPPYAEWQRANPEVRALPFPEAGAHGDSWSTRPPAPPPWQRSRPPARSTWPARCFLTSPSRWTSRTEARRGFWSPTTDSLGEQIQRAYPDARVVKALNTVFVDVMIEPTRVPGRHTIFVAGDDASAKGTVQGLLREFGWPAEDIVDLGGIRASRATEMYMPLFFTLVGVLESFHFNVAVVRGDESAVASAAADRALEEPA